MSQTRIAWLVARLRRRWRWSLLLLALLVGVGFLISLNPRAAQLLLRRDTTWHTIQAEQRWRVGLDPSFPPFEWLDDQGQPQGYDVALAQQIAQQWGVQVEFIAIGYDSLLDALRTGQVESVVSALPFDERMTEDIAYSPPYFDAGIVLATLPQTPITNTAALHGHLLGVEWGSMGEMEGRKLQRDDTTIQIQRLDSPAAVIDALVTAQSVDAILIDHVTLRIAQVNGAKLVTIGPMVESNPYVIAMPRLAYELHDAVATALQTLQERGVLTKLETKWFVGVK
ncbi:MAG: ABC transporter substrate-binding protein [Caldilineaceae bacterium]